MRRRLFAGARALLAVLACAGSACSSATPRDSVDARPRDAAVTVDTQDVGRPVDRAMPPDVVMPVDTATPMPARLPPVSATSVFVHLFEWPWPDIARECETFLGPHGFAGVQISPPSEHTVRPDVGFPWWQRYQTVSHRLDRSRSGTRAEFIDMVERCARAGVAIYADAVINHMTALPSGVGSAGTAFEKYRYPGLFEAADFHMPPCGIAPADYAQNASVVQRCELDGLADLDTAAPRVRGKIVDYLRALLALGVQGFRIDAAKHIPAADLEAIVMASVAGAPPGTRPYVFLEVIDYGSEAVRARDYLEVGRGAEVTVDITEFKATGVGAHFLGRNGQTLAQLRDFSPATWNLLPRERALVFTNNHDTQRGDGFSYRDGAAHDLATLFLLAWPYGRVVVASSYAFDGTSQSGRDRGPASDQAGNTVRGMGCPAEPPPASLPSGAWVCEHRRAPIAAMATFRRVAGDAPVALWWDNGGNQIAFARQGRGFVVINNESAPLTRRFLLGLPAGRYCDVVRSGTAGSCADPIAVDATGGAMIDVPARTARVYHLEARPAN